ncbi:Nodulation protein A (N-acyltransferase) [Bradyrhizobium sp. ORS 285]|uniref:Nodulation protein A n=6 Tax=unclassified Bradyrhizobium TaxID=2631580 RepID=Q7AUU8_9BRAD|nr:NodA family N-acyltransferase [Bradyrhizobium sp. ORS 285]CAD26847.1 nodulation protein A [Bradyrhizobium sp. ORS 287]CAD26854.1 nodulation protein A [Bradyrhizobium sp. ORS 364]CAD27492.1 nodulation protein A [Bradyrhizobium sp. ORS 352]AAK50870.1 nodulation protein NodA [Bradyrhizobium sp. ORS 285]CCA64470.1 Nodulation protein A (N-acyltransferase) [Bradyrhizobium sp. ORS 285]
MRSQLRWSVCWESDLAVSDHLELSEFFQIAYGLTGSSNALPFMSNRSWAGARPELRVIGYDKRGVAAHLAVLRRFIKVENIDVLVAELGLYAIRPDLEGRWLANSLRVMHPALKQLSVPFGFGTVRSALERHVGRLLGRPGLATILHGVKVRSTLSEVYQNLSATRVDEPLVLVFPIVSPLSKWPPGATIERNGPEL